MFSRYLILSISLLIICQYVNTQPSCQPLFNTTLNLYPTQGETQIFSLNNLFSGFNLSFMSQGSGSQNCQINQSLTQYNNSNYQNNIIDLELEYAPSDNATIAALQQDNQGNYIVNFGIINSENSVNFSFNFPIQADGNTTCYDLAYLNQDIIVIDCTNKSSDLTVLYMLNQSNSTYPYQINGNQIMSPFVSRQSLSYNNNQNSYLLVYTPFNMFLDPNVENFIDVYIYNPTPTQEEIFGDLSTSAPIQQDSLQVDNLQIVSVQTINNTIIILDHYLGLITFQYEADSVQNLQKFNILNGQQTWGMSISLVGSNTILIIVTNNMIYEYQWNNLQIDPVLLNKYKVNWPQQQQFQKVAIPSVNLGYIVVQYNDILAVYQRNKPQLSNLLTSINSQYYILLSSSTLINFYNNVASNLNIGQALMFIQTSGQQASSTFVVNAISNYYGQTTSCQIKFQAQQISDVNNQSAQSTGINATYNTKIDDITTIDIPLGGLYIGPNIQYSINITQQQSNSQQLDEDLQQSIQYAVVANIPNNITINNFQIQPNQVQFMKNVFLNDTFFYSLTQLINNSVISFQCQTYYPVFTVVNCQNPSGFVQNLAGQIVLYAQDWNQQSKLPIWAEVSSDNLLLINVYNFNLQLINSYSYSQGVQKILDLKIDNNLIYVLKSMVDGSFTIDIFQLVNQQIQLYLEITSEMLNSFPYFSSFNPQRIAVSSSQPGVLFVQSPTMIWALSITQGSVFYLTHLNISPPNEYINIGLWITNKVLILAYDGPYGYIQEYSLLDLQQILLTKNYPMYGLQIYTNLTASFSQQTQLFYILMQNQAANQFSIYVYRPGQELISSLYQVFALKESQIISPLIYAGGNNADILYFLNNQTKQYTYRVPVISSFSTKFSLTNYFQYSAIMQINTIVVPWNNTQTPLQFPTNVTLINTLQNTQINQQQINEQYPFLESQFNVTDKMTYPLNLSFLDTNWYNGQVINQSLASNQTNFKLYNHLQITNKNYLNLPQAIDMFTDTSTQLQFYLTLDNNLNTNLTGVQIIKKIPVQIFTISLNTAQSEYCSKIVPQYDQYDNLLNINIICSQFGSFFIYQVNATLNQQQQYIATITNQYQLDYIISSQGLGDAYFMDGYLLLLSFNGNSKIGQIYVNQLNQQTNSSQLIQTFNSSNINIQNSQVNISSFDIWNVSGQIRKLVFTNNKQFVQVLSIDAGQGYQKFNVDITLDILQILQAQNLTLPLNEYFVQISIYGCNISESKQINLQYLLVTNSIGTLQMNTYFNQSLDNYPIISAKLMKIFAPYGSNVPMNKLTLQFQRNRNLLVKVQPLFFAIPYVNRKTNIVTMAIYNLIQIPQKQMMQGNLSLITMLAGIEFPDSQQFTLTFVNNIGAEIDLNPLIYCSNPADNSVAEIQLSYQMHLEVNDNTWKTQNITFIPHGQYVPNNINISLPISYIVIPTPSSSSDKPSSDGLQWYYILLIVIGGVILISLGSYLILKGCKKKSEDTNGDLEQNNAESTQKLVNPTTISTDK